MTAGEPSPVWRLNARTLPLKLALTAALLVILHIGAMTIYFEGVLESQGFDLHYWQIDKLDLDNEDGFGTWFAAILLLLCGGLLRRRWRQVRAAGEPWAAWWLVLAVGFVFLSMDEVVGFHEYTQSTLKSLYGGHMRWTHAGIPVAVLVGLLFVPFLSKGMPRRTALWFVVGGALYLGGAVVVEKGTDWYADEGLINTTEYHLWIALEEGLEMVGPIVFLRALLVLMVAQARDDEGFPVEDRPGSMDAVG